MKVHFNNLKIKQLFLKHNGNAILISDNINSMNYLYCYKKIDKLILFHDNFLNNFNSNHDIIHYIKKQNLI